VQTHYELLGIEPEASTHEVKSAFRQQAKKLHPDLAASSGRTFTPGELRSREIRMRLLLEAYRILSDPEKRRAYDRSLRRRQEEEQGFNYHDFLLARQYDPEFQAKLIVFDLLHEMDDEAMATYERATAFGSAFRMEYYLERGEAMDAEFCIGEEYEKRGSCLRAYSIYKKLIIMESEKPTFRYFFEVVTLRYRSILILKLPKFLEDEDYLRALDEAAGLKISARDSALFLRKKAEVQLRLHDPDGALLSLEMAAELVPRLPGLKALRKRAAMAGFDGPSSL